MFMFERAVFKKSPEDLCYLFNVRKFEYVLKKMLEDLFQDPRNYVKFYDNLSLSYFLEIFIEIKINNTFENINPSRIYVFNNDKSAFNEYLKYDLGIQHISDLKDMATKEFGRMKAFLDNHDDILDYLDIFIAERDVFSEHSFNFAVLKIIEFLKVEVLNKLVNEDTFDKFLDYYLTYYKNFYESENDLKESIKNTIYLVDKNLSFDKIVNGDFFVNCLPFNNFKYCEERHLSVYSKNSFYYNINNYGDNYYCKLKIKRHFLNKSYTANLRYYNEKTNEDNDIEVLIFKNKKDANKYYLDFLKSGQEKIEKLLYKKNESVFF